MLAPTETLYKGVHKGYKKRIFSTLELVIFKLVNFSPCCVIYNQSESRRLSVTADFGQRPLVAIILSEPLTDMFAVYYAGKAQRLVVE
jgi:hypothetical protein